MGQRVGSADLSTIGNCASGGCDQNLVVADSVGQRQPVSLVLTRDLDNQTGSNSAHDRNLPLDQLHACTVGVEEVDINVARLREVNALGGGNWNLCDVGGRDQVVITNDAVLAHGLTQNPTGTCSSCGVSEIAGLTLY